MNTGKADTEKTKTREIGKRHLLRLSNLDLGDGHRALVCHQCDRVLSVKVTENDIILWWTLRGIRQGNFFAMHEYIKGTGFLSVFNSA